MKKYIKLNNSDEHLSLGNLFRIIKLYSINKNSALQLELFYTIFNVENINDTTVNNYCIGCRSIGSDYKQIYLNYQKKYNTDKKVLEDIVINIVSILEGIIINTKDKINYINNSELFKKLCIKLYNISKNDKQIKKEFSNEILKKQENNNYYESFCDILFFIILDKIQPIYNDDQNSEVLENLLKNTTISASELEEFLNFKFRESTNYDYSIRKLASKKNPYACYELGTEEYYGHISGKPRYDISYNYLKVAMEAKHPGATYLIGNMFFKKMIGAGKNEDLSLAFEYFTKAMNYGSIEAINCIGLFYLNGIYPVEKNENKAIEYFKKGSSYNYVYSYNNLGHINELHKNYKQAFEYYLKSADMKDSWACNKVGEFYRTGILGEINLEKAFNYYTLALECNHRNLYYYAKYNLAKYYYLNGCKDIVLVKNKELAMSYLIEAKENGIIEASIELIYIYLEEYYQTQNKELLKNINENINIIETSNKYTEELRIDIQNKINKIKNQKKLEI